MAPHGVHLGYLGLPGLPPLELGHHFPTLWLSSNAPAHKIKPPGILPSLPVATRGYPSLPAATPGNGVRNCCSDPTSTRAGGQDDVSYTNSLKLCINPYIYIFD